MIIERRSEKLCNICRKTLAVKRFLFFHNVATYTTINMEYDGITGNGSYEMHICERCWERLKTKIRSEVGIE